MAKERKDKSSQFDKLLKENVEALFLPLTEKYLGVSIAKAEDIALPLQKTLERKPDFAKKVTDKSGEIFILHIEFQTSDERKMIDRMQHYHALLRQKYQVPVRQFVVYLGRNPLRYMRHQLEEDEIFSGYTLSDLHDYDYERLLASEVPEDILLFWLTILRISLLK